MTAATSGDLLLACIGPQGLGGHSSPVLHCRLWDRCGAWVVPLSV